MKILFMFDSSVNIRKIGASSFKRGTKVYLFPLTSKVSIIDVVRKKIDEVACDVDTIHVAELVNRAADRLRDKYIQFVAEIPERVLLRGKNLKELFAVDDCTSMWWFSLIAEKNTYKSDSFNTLAQFDSAVQVIKREKISKIIFGCRSEKLKSAVHAYSHKCRIGFKSLPTEQPVERFKSRVRRSQRFLYLKHIILLINAVIHTLLRTRTIKRRIGRLKRVIPQDENALLFFTPYANIDKTLAEKGVFKNRYYTHLQEAMEDSKQSIIWIAMYVASPSTSFMKSLEYAERFIKNGYTIFFPEEFSSLKAQIKALYTVLMSGFKFLTLQRRLYAAHDFEDYNIYLLFRDDWYSSFIGETGYCGIMYYYMFKVLLKKIKARKCLYLCEMQAWERALVFARDALGAKTALYGYQPSTVSRMYLPYFNHSSEISDKGRYSISRPDKIICNGNISYGHISGSGWPKERLSIVEAIRYTHLKKYLELQSSIKKQNIVALVLSISPEESSSILNIVYEAFRDRKDVEVWLRPHPFLRIESVFEFSGIHKADFNFKVKDGKLDDILSKARVVVAGESGVSIEAIAHGCDVIIVDVPEWINMSPLKALCGEAVRSVDSPESLRETILSIFQERYDSEKRVAEAKRIINDFFYLNQETDMPKDFLKLLMDASE